MLRTTFIILIFCLGHSLLAETEYFALYIQDAKVGYAAMESFEEPNRVIEQSEYSLSLRRDEATVVVNVNQTMISDRDGVLQSFTSRQDLGILAMTVSGRRNDQGIMEVTTQSGEITRQQLVPLPPDVVTETDLQQMLKEKGLAPGTVVKASIFEPITLTVMEAELRVGQTESVNILGRTEKLVHIVQILRPPTSPMAAVLPLPSGQMQSDLYMTEDFRPRKIVQETMGMKVELLACDKALALSPSEVSDFFSRTFVRSPQRLGNTKRLESVRYRLHPQKPGGWALPETAEQAIEKTKDGDWIVTVKTAALPSDVKIPYQGSDPRALAALEPTRFLQSDSPVIHDLATEAIGRTQDAAQAALRIERFVHRYVQTKSMDVAYASALEVAKFRQGDCTEHAVLAAALCRAAGLPAEVAFGYVYTDEFAGQQQVFVGHAWCQVFIDGQWYGIDATRAPNGYDPGHILLGCGNGGLEDSLAFMGNLELFTITEVEIRP